MGTESPLIRIAEPSDGPALAAIYAPHVERSPTSFEVQPPSAEEMSARIQNTLARYPWLVATQDEQVLGYVYASEHHPRAAYQWGVDVSVYVREDTYRRGVGRYLYLRLFDLLRQQGFYIAYAGITLPNPASVGLHEALGFSLIGIYKAAGFKLGAWHDVGWWRLSLQAPTPDPASPIPFSELRTDHV